MIAIRGSRMARSEPLVRNKKSQITIYRVGAKRER